MAGFEEAGTIGECQDSLNTTRKGGRGQPEDDDFPLPEKHIVKSSGKRNYSNWFQAYMEHVDYTESPRLFHKLSALFALAAVCKRHLWLDGGTGAQWTPNLYILLVGPPGVARKSSTLGIASRLVQTAGVVLGPPQATWESLFQVLTGYRERRPVGDDANYQSTPASFALDEINTLLDFSNSTLASLLTQWFDSPYEKITRSTLARGKETIFAPCINIAACTTNAYMREHVSSFARGGGLMSRTLIAYGDTKYQIVPKPSGHPKYAQCVAMTDKLAEDLDYIHDNLNGPYELSPCGDEFNNEWYYEQERKNAEAIKNGDDDAVGFSARLQVQMGKVGLLLAVAQGDRPMVFANHLKDALEIIKEVQLTTSAVVQPRIVSTLVQSHIDLLQFLRKYPGGLSREAVMMGLMMRIDLHQLETLFDKSISMGLIQKTQKGTKIVYSLSPAALTALADSQVGKL